METKPHLLVVDDDRDIRNLIRDYLLEHGSLHPAPKSLGFGLAVARDGPGLPTSPTYPRFVTATGMDLDALWP